MQPYLIEDFDIEKAIIICFYMEGKCIEDQEEV